MAKTLLNGVNELLKKTDVLDSDVGVLTSISDSGRQVFIDTAIQAINETLDELYDFPWFSKPKQLRDSTITLVAGTNNHSLHSQALELRYEFHLIDETNDHIIQLLAEDGYWQQIMGDLGQDDTGLPSSAAISPVNGRLYFNRTPTANEAGRVYKYRYDRDMVLDEATDDFPFNDKVFRHLIAAAAERYKLHRHQEFQQGLFNRELANAARALRQLPPRRSYGKTGVGVNATDPFNDVITS